jgi:uncharacterized protein (DUF1800 family)
MPLSSPRSLLRALSAALLALAATIVSAAPMGESDARHLLARTGFGPTAAEVREYARLSRQEAIGKLLAETRTTSVTQPPAWTSETGPLRPAPAAIADEAERRAFLREQARRGGELRAWWIREMLATPSPLTERMTLFWHNHFVSSQQKVRVVRLMYAQNATFRAHAIGDFGALLHAASKDPAMVVYLDSARNRKGAPNENFAREVMELFTLGQGRYTEQDIKEAARAFTGWSVDRDTGSFAVRPRLHDDDVKTVFGKAGRFDGDAILDLLLARRETSEFIVAKLWREFVSPEPDAREVTRIAQAFRGASYDLKVALRELLGTSAFWDVGNRATLVKSPIEVVVGTLRQLDVAPEETQPLALVAAGMGQNLFAPPNVKGWPGGNAWINSNTLLARKQFLDRLARNDAGPPPMIAAEPSMPVAEAIPFGDEGLFTRRVVGPPTVPQDESARAARLARQIDRTTRALRFDAAQWMSQRDGQSRDEKLAAARRLLLPIPAQLPIADDADLVTAIHAALLDPAYQLK